MHEDTQVDVAQALKRLCNPDPASQNKRAISDEVRAQTLRLIHGECGGIPDTMKVSVLLNFVHQAEDLLNQPAIEAMRAAMEEPFNSNPLPAMW